MFKTQVIHFARAAGYKDHQCSFTYRSFLGMFPSYTTERSSGSNPALILLMYTPLDVARLCRPAPLYPLTVTKACLTRSRSKPFSVNWYCPCSTGWKSCTWEPPRVVPTATSYLCSK